MKCFNCGKESENYLCDKCHNEETLDKIYNEILSFKKEENKHIKEYVEGLENEYAVWDCIPNILETFDDNIAEYYYCHYYKLKKDPKFEEMAINYLNTHDLMDNKKQRILYDILSFYLRNDFVKPKKWCDLIENSKEDLAIELYNISAEFYSMIGEYELSKKLIDKGKNNIKSKPIYIFSDDEKMSKSFDKLEGLLIRYTTKSPYWPTTEERRRAVAAIYDEKGIKYPRIESKPTKVKESEFKPIKEIYDNLPDNYVCFWCAETYNEPTIKCIYQIGAVRVKNGKLTEEYQSFIRPWDGLIAKKRAASEANVEIETIESARDVDLVMKEFIDFIGEDILVSTDALGNQAKIFIRALRYGGINEIKNGFFDILDYAIDIDSKFDLENNNREYLLKYFKIEEGKDSLEKAKVNYKLLCKLKELEK